MRRRERARPGAAPLPALALAVATLAGPARGEGLSAYLEPGYTLNDTTTTDQTLTTTHARTQSLVQKYRLSLDRDLYRNLSLGAGGIFQDTLAWGTVNGSSQPRSDDQLANGFARIALTTPILSAGVDYNRGERWPARSPSALVNEVLSSYGVWRPLDAPDLDLRLSRTHQYDTLRRQSDETVSSALLGAHYGAGKTDLRYTLLWANPVDDLTGTSSRSLDQSLQATHGDRLFDGRTVVYGSAALAHRTLTTTVSGQGSGKVNKQQFPIAGLSVVETFPGQAAADTLAPNPALIDGNTAVSASVDIGFAPTDRNARDVGAQFADVVTSVNTMYVWVDKTLTAPVAQALASSFAVFRSDDNQRWTPVTIVGAVQFGTFQNRFEIGIEQTQARFLKVVMAPLVLTTDATFADIFVTEVQFSLVQTAVAREESSWSTALSASARTQLTRSPSLSHDITASLNHQDLPSLTTYSVVNGLSFSEWLSRAVLASARVARHDQDLGVRHEALWEWNGSLAARPLPTLSGALTYGGQLNETQHKTTHSLSLFGRGDLYEGISTQANLGATLATLSSERTSLGESASASASFVPNRFVTFSTQGAYTNTTTYLGSQPESTTRFARVDGTVSARPAPALSASGSVGVVVVGARSRTLGALQVNFSPLHGDLQLSTSYSRTFDTASQAAAQLASTSVRWNVRPGAVLTASYTFLDSTSPVQATTSHILGTNLTLAL